LKIADGKEIKLTGTTANTGDTKFAGGGGILFNGTSGNKLGVGSGIMLYNATDSTATTAAAGKIVGETANTASGVTGSNGLFAATGTTNTFALTAY
jgi:hypothetical protein